MKKNVFLCLFFCNPLPCLTSGELEQGKKMSIHGQRYKMKKEIRKMNKYGFDIEEIDFDIEDLIERLEKEHGRMIVRIPKMTQTAPFVYEFLAIFSDFSLLEAKMAVIPKITRNGFEASITVHGVYL
jgi:hypothetical protein